MINNLTRNPSNRSDRAPGGNRSFLVLRFSSLGDCVLLCPLLSHLKAQAAQEVVVVTKSVYKELFAAVRGVDRIIAIEKKDSLRSLFDIALSFKGKKHTVIDAHNNLRSRIFTSVLGRRGPRLKKYYQDRLALIIFKKQKDMPSMLIRYGKLGESLGLPPLPPRIPSLEVPERVSRKVSQTLGGSQTRFVAVAPGSRWPTKRWGKDNFLALSARIVKRYGYRILLVGDKGDAAMNAGIGESLGRHCIDLTGKTGIIEAAGFLQRSSALVGNDSGLMHLSEAVGTPVLALFGPTVEQFGYYPSLPGSKVCERSLACRPCSRKGSRICPKGTQECLSRIGVDEVERAFKDLLQGEGPKRYVLP